MTITLEEAMERYASASNGEVDDISRDRADEFLMITKASLLAISILGRGDEVLGNTLLGHLVYGYLAGVRDSIPIPDAFKEDPL